MKLIIILLTTAILQVSAAGYAQKVTLIQNNARLSTVLDEIRKQTGYDFVYSDKVMNDAKRVSLNLKNAELDEALEICFKDQPLSFKVEDKMVIIRPKEKSYLEGLVDRFLAVDVKGRVVDSLGVGLSGATVSVKNGKGSTSTAANGDFYLKNVEEGSVLVISFMGYVTKEQPASKDFNYVILKQSTSQLDEVLVQAYGTTTRRLSTGNIAMVTSKEIVQQNINNPLLTLQGRVAGVEITQLNGMPGAPINIKIRGQYSRSGGDLDDPLIVIDGVPFTNNIVGLGSPAGNSNNVGLDAGQMSAFNFINPNEIESISVLKDGDATSIYGSRGSKGVILITTKKGKVGRTTADITANSGWQDVAKKIKLLNTQQYLEMKKEAMYLNNFLPRLQNPTRYAGAYPELLVWDQQKNTDWQDVLLGGTASYTNIQGSISGGTDLMQYRLGGTFHKESYVFPGNAYDQKGNVNISLGTTSPNRKFSARLNAGYLFNSNITPPVDLTKAAMTLAPNAPDLYNESGGINWAPNPYSPFNVGTFIDNPVRDLMQPFSSKVNSLTSSAEVSYELIPRLILKTAIGFTKLNGSSLNIDNNSISTEPVAAEGFGDYLRYSSFMNTGMESWSIEPQITYNTKIADGGVDILVGSSLQNQSTSTSRIDAYGFNDDALMQSLSHAKFFSNIGNTSSQYKYNAVFARIKYNWQEKYIINLSGRRDGSSRFGPNRQFGNFWSLGTAWIFSEEKFIKSLSPLLSFGKFRFSFGTAGNDGIGDYKFFELYTPVGDIDTYRGVKLLNSSGIANPYFGWESVRKLEFGLDLGFFKDRINISSAYFRNRSSNLLGVYALPNMVGPSGEFITNNPALIQTSGWEFVINSSNLSGSHLTWNSSLNVGFMKNKLLADNDGDRTRPGLGQPFYGSAGLIVFNGVDPKTGQYQFLGRDGNPTFLPDSATAIPIKTQPIFSGGLRNTFNYKKISVDIFLQFVKQNGKNYLFQFANAPGVTPFGNGNQTVEVMNRWKNVGDQAIFQRFTLGAPNPVPDFTILDAFSAVRDKSTAGWVDASFIRLKTVSLSYNLTDFAKKKLRLNNLRVFAQGQNILTWTKYKGTDPETQNPFVLPPLRTITAGIQLTL